jgi:hypothetical protein
METEKEYAVDFYLAGTVTLKAKSKDEARYKASQIGMDKLADCVENSGFGKYYIDKL